MVRALLFWLCDCRSWCCLYSLMVEAWLWQLCFLVWVETSHQHTASLLPSPCCVSRFFCPSQPNNFSSTLYPPSVCVLFFNSPPFFLAFCLPPLPLSSVCSRVMVCCGLPTQRNNISGVGKVQPHMSCAAEGRLCEVRPIPHGSYSSQPRDQRPAIPLPSSSSSSYSSSSHHH